MNTVPVLASIQIGAPTTYPPDGNEGAWTTAFFKTPIEGGVVARQLGLDGDGQADRDVHGGIDKAVLAYSADHYHAWRTEFGRHDVPYGGFGENLTITGLTEETVCIGDVFGIGDASFEVSQPRQPCWKLGRRWQMHELPARVIRTGRSGWYFRVLEEGRIEQGMPAVLLARLNPEWSIARANRIFHHHAHDLELTRQLAGVPHLSEAWVSGLQHRATRLR